MVSDEYYPIIKTYININREKTISDMTAVPEDDDEKRDS
jgi:hypothetical protein